MKLLPGVFFLAACAAFAQDSSQPTPAPQQNRVHHDSAEKRLKRISKRLKLTDEQKEKLRPILEEEEKETAAVSADTTLSQQQRHKKMHEIRLNSRSQMDPILTPEQQAQMPKMHAGGGGHHRQHSGQTSAPSGDSNTPQ
jgi:Spy/CpxP family protein refolding chaperone